MKIRSLKEEDFGEILTWRNDKYSRKMCLQEEKISLEEHENWLKNSLDNPNIDFFLGEFNGDKLGIVRFDLDENKKFSEISINMNPDMRSKGFGKKLLKKAIKNYLERKKVNLNAKVKKINNISLNLFLKVGFLIIDKNDHLIFMEYMKKLYFKEIDNSNTNVLYELLKQRRYLISHKKMPSYQDHIAFVQSHPYLNWYIVSHNEHNLGTFYIKKDNSIGLNLVFPCELLVKEVLNFILLNFQPQKELKSQTPPYFYVNVAEGNKTLMGILTDLKFEAIQVSFKLN